MATWNLESVGTKGYGGGGSYFCARAAKAILKRKEERDEENYDGIGVFKDPLLDSVYGQCSSTTRPLRQSMHEDPNDVADLLKPTELEQALAQARAQHGKNKSKSNGNRMNGNVHGGGSRHRGADDGMEDIQVVFEEPFTSSGGRKGGIPLLCMGSSEHTVYVLQVLYNGRRWSVERRYSEFNMLDTELRRLWVCDPSVRLGELPSKVWMGKLAKETQSKRKDELEQYLNNLLSQTRMVQESAELRAFLEIPPRSDGVGQGPGPVISRPGSRSSVRGGRMNAERDFDEMSL